MTDQSVISTRTRRRPEARPSEILEAALDLFTEKGFTATRLEDVASRAGISKAAIYLYFNDKTSLLTALVRDLMGPNLAMATSLIAAHEGPVGPLIEQVLALLARRMADGRLPLLVKLIISEGRAHPELGRSYLDNVIGRALPLFQALVEKGIASGEFRKVDAAMTVRCMIAPMLLAAVWKSVFEPIGAEPLDVEALARADADVILRGLKP